MSINDTAFSAMERAAALLKKISRQSVLSQKNRYVLISRYLSEIKGKQGCLCLTIKEDLGIIPSLTLVKVKNGYKPSKYGHCSRFPFCSDMYYIISVLILFALYL